MRAAFAAIDSCVAVHADGELLYTNEAMLARLDGGALRQLTAPAQRERLDRLLAGGATAAEAFTGPRGRRLEIPHSAPFRFRGRQARLLIARDVTEQALLQERLVVAGRMASLGTLAAGAAHEINNPLTYVQLNIDHALTSLAEPNPDMAEVLEVLEEARDGAARIGGIVSELQQYSKVRAPTNSPVHVLTAARRAVRLAEPKMGATIGVELDISPDLHVRTNGDHLVQVLLNLLLNAGQAILSSAATGTVRVTAEESGSVVSVDVADDGPGMSAEVLARIFDPFFTTKAEGTGLGLALSQRMVADSGGTLTAASEGAGSRFTLVLPLARPEETAPPMAPPDVPDVRRARVLVVDDELLVGKAIARMLRQHEVHHAENGERALELLDTFDADVILCDVNMPGMRGDELLRHLRGRGDRRPFAFITGGTLDQNTRELAEREGVRILQKPFTLQDLDALLAALDDTFERPPTPEHAS